MFKPDMYRALLIGCDKYDVIRGKGGDDWTEFSDMNGSVEVESIKSYLKRCSFKDEDIVILKEPSVGACKQAILELIDFCVANYINDE